MDRINLRCNQSEESKDYWIIQNYYQSESSKESDDKTLNICSAVFMDSSNLNSITSWQESDWDIKETGSITEYLQVTPDGLEQTEVFNVTSVDFDKRIEYVNDLIKRINAGDKYTWNFERIKTDNELYDDILQIIKENYSNKLNSSLDFNSDSQTNYDSRTYSRILEEGMILYCSHYMIETLKYIGNILLTVKWYNAISTLNNS